MKRLERLLNQNVILLVSVAVGMTIVFVGALLLGLNQSTWFDEGYSIIVARQPIDQIIALTAVDAHPPLYYLLLKLWATIFGWSELSLRASSATCGALAIGVMALLLRKLFSTKTAIISIPFLVIAPFLLRYEYEIRMYALVVLVGITATYVLVKARKLSSKRWWFAYSILVIIGIYTLYLSVVFWLAHVTWLVMQDKNMPLKKIILQPYIAAYCAAFLAFLPWIPTVLYQLTNSALPPFMSAMTLQELVTIVGMTLTFTPVSKAGAWASLGIVLWTILFITSYVKVWRRSSDRTKQGILLLSLCFIVGIIFYTLLSLPPNPPRFMERYAIHLTVYVYALIGVVVALAWQYHFRRYSVSLAAVSLILLTYGTFNLSIIGNYNLQREQSMQARSIRETYGCHDTTYVTAGPFGYIDMSYEMRQCDLRFYYPSNAMLVGGYAPLNNSPNQIKDSQAITTKRIIFSYFVESTDILLPDSRYRLVAQNTFDKTMTKVYELR